MCTDLNVSFDTKVHTEEVHACETYSHAYNVDVYCGWFVFIFLVIIFW
jgi:hypothetical protein